MPILNRMGYFYTQNSEVTDIDQQQKFIIEQRKQNVSWQTIADQLHMPKDSVRDRVRHLPEYKEIRQFGTNAVVMEEEQNKMTTNYHSDGTISKNVLTRLKEKRTFTKDEILELAGFDSKEFNIRTSTINEWTTPIDGTPFYNYQIKVVAEPIKQSNLLDDILKSIKEYTQPFDIDCVDYDKLTDTLIINLPDLHFGPNTAKEYSEYQSEILIQLENQYENVVIGLLGDLFNADNFKSKTIHDTRVGDTDLPNAWEEATLFLEPIIQKSLTMSPNVDIIYSRGNHDETIAWAFAKYLEAKYPQANHNNSTDQLKCVLIDGNAIYFTHGHVRKKNFVNLCATLYPKEWAEAANRLLFTGHYHSIKSEDMTGIVHYQLPTISKHTEYEKENLFLGSQNGVHLFELGHGKVNAIFYL